MNEELINMETVESEVLVESPAFCFNCAHFIAYKGFKETLHGHNYTVSVKMKGYIQDDGYVIDFSLLKNAVRNVCKQLDHHFILPMNSDVLKIEHINNNIKITCEDNSEYSIPKNDCIKIPIKHSSTEEIGFYIMGKIIEELDVSFLKIRKVYYIEVCLNESPTQKAIVSQSI